MFPSAVLSSVEEKIYIFCFISTLISTYYSCSRTCSRSVLAKGSSAEVCKLLQADLLMVHDMNVYLCKCLPVTIVHPYFLLWKITTHLLSVSRTNQCGHRFRSVRLSLKLLCCKEMEEPPEVFWHKDLAYVLSQNRCGENLLKLSCQYAMFQSHKIDGESLVITTNY